MLKQFLANINDLIFLSSSDILVLVLFLLNYVATCLANSFHLVQAEISGTKCCHSYSVENNILKTKKLKWDPFQCWMDSLNLRYPEMSGTDALQRQLQQLFHLHDACLDQAFIDVLPVFMYKEIMGLKEPFDCPVCLCEFSEDDKLRLLPICSHAFHTNCIDTWLLLNSTCPFCKGTLFQNGFSMENPVYDFDEPREEDCVQGNYEAGFVSSKKPIENGVTGEKMIYPVILGKFRNFNNNEAVIWGGVTGGGGALERDALAKTSSSNLDARRCFSIGSFQCVVDGSTLQVALSKDKDYESGHLKLLKGRVVQNGHTSIDVDLLEWKKLSSGYGISCVKFFFL